MPAADVWRYGFEAAALLVRRKNLRLAEPVGDPPLNAMATLRTSRAIARVVRQIHEDMHPELYHQVIVRRLLETIMPIAEKKGMAYVMGLREKNL